jgi:hypothetical protein
VTGARERQRVHGNHSDRSLVDRTLDSDSFGVTPSSERIPPRGCLEVVVIKIFAHAARLASWMAVAIWSR